ncbi:hypothetical protein [Metabacillus iocasae]|uniref:Magnesium-transporting ATPase (P-type) n=1 Tax=Priestia iocasae TaxID=2291674 RepID=A0ABS2QVA0_9BACI|nr:hypothetical protein [Metabacillus iocasae]MBM7703379.1 magnesium-transporting ATPase (P-type) [Metabacillus iocasae]
MKIRSYILIFVTSFIFTIFTPFIFNTYVDKVTVGEKVAFGVPFPFVFQQTETPFMSSSTPIAVTFNSYFNEHVTFSLIPFLLSLVSSFFLFLAISYLFQKLFSFRMERNE